MVTLRFYCVYSGITLCVMLLLGISMFFTQSEDIREIEVKIIIIISMVCMIIGELQLAK